MKALRTGSKHGGENNGPILQVEVPATLLMQTVKKAVLLIRCSASDEIDNLPMRLQVFKNYLERKFHPRLAAVHGAQHFVASNVLFQRLQQPFLAQGTLNRDQRHDGVGAALLLQRPEML